MKLTALDNLLSRAYYFSLKIVEVEKFYLSY